MSDADSPEDFEQLEMLRDASECRAAKTSDDGIRIGLDELR